ncbi:MAG: hypothetical protein ABI794_08785 [Betaproteobacteria bacterium]
MLLRKRALLGTIAITLALIVGWGAGTLRSGATLASTGGRTMTVVRLYTGSDGRSHFEDLQVPLKDGGKVGFLSERVRATGILFRETEGDYNYDFHTAPRRQYVVNLQGEVEIEVGDGTRRILRSGDVLLAEDTTGQGHISRAVKGKPRKSLFITLDD